MPPPLTYETSLSRAHNQSYSDVLYQSVGSFCIPLNQSNSYFFNLIVSGGFIHSGEIHSFGRSMKFGVTFGPNSQSETNNLQIYGYTFVQSVPRDKYANTYNSDVKITLSTKKVGLQDFLCIDTTPASINATYKGTVVSCPLLFDWHADKFFNQMGFTGGIVGDQIRSSVTRLVLDLKSKFIWNKLECLYPFVGGVSASHRLNLRNPAVYSLTYSVDSVGTVSHSSMGVKISTPSSGFIDTGFTLNPLTTKDLSMGVYTDGLVNPNWPFNPTYSIGNLMGSFTTSGGGQDFSIGVVDLIGNTNIPSLVYMDSIQRRYRGVYRTSLQTSATTTEVSSGLWALARIGNTFSYIGLNVPGFHSVSLYRTPWYIPFESYNLYRPLKPMFGRKRVYSQSSMGLSYFTSSIYIGNLHGTTSFPTDRTIKSAFIGFSMSNMDLLYMSEILTKFNASLGRR